MLLSLKELQGITVLATDGEAGKVHSFIFDDRYWTVRYMVVETGGWMKGRRVLLLPEHLGKPDISKKIFPVKLTRGQVEDRPGIDTEKPVSEQQENIRSFAGGWDPYDERLRPPEPMDAEMAVLVGMARERSGEVGKGNPDLHSSGAVIGYRVHGNDEQAGKICDLIADGDGWRIRYMAVDTGRRVHGRKVLVAPDWVLILDWRSGTVHLDLSRDDIDQSPEYVPESVIGRGYEEVRGRQYGRRAA